MARILYASQVNEIKGSIGGLSFQRNGSGTTCRLKPSRVQAVSVKQSESQVLFNKAVAAWAALAWDVQNDWNIFAAAHTKFNYWGEEKVLSGYNWYTSIYCNVALCGGTFPSSPPVWSTPLAVPTFGSLIDATNFELNFDPVFIHTSQYVFVYASPPLMSISVKNRKLLRLIKVVAPSSDLVIDIKSEWLAEFGFSSMPDPSGGRYFVQVSLCTIESTYFFNSAFTSQSLEVAF